MTAMVWFRRDLRLGDNPAWDAATSHHDEVSAVFVLDSRLYDVAGPHRGPQLVAHLAALDAELKRLGGRLRVIHGDPLEVVPQLARGHEAVYANRDYSPYAVRRDDAVAERGVPIHWYDGVYVVPPGTVTTAEDKPYQVFTPFYRKWSKTAWPAWPVGGQAAVAGDPGDGLPEAGKALLPGGEGAAGERLEQYLDSVDSYTDVRDRPDLDATSRLSADLKFGTLSPRRVIDEVGTATPGREAFVRQLAWREFYAQIMRAFPHTVDHALRPEYDSVRWRTDEAGLEAWKEGRTGYPIVDAGMRQLAREGWMHNRVRMITASFLVKDLLIDWRLGERHFRRLLLDAEPAQNVGNWQWVAGTGADAAPYFRIFNPVSQSKKFDPNGDYIRRYVPELSGVSAADIHTPWDAPGLQLAAADVTLGETYPLPIVDHAEARERTLAAYQAARQ